MDGGRRAPELSYRGRGVEAPRREEGAWWLSRGGAAASCRSAPTGDGTGSWARCVLRVCLTQREKRDAAAAVAAAAVAVDPDCIPPPVRALCERIRDCRLLAVPVSFVYARLWPSSLVYRAGGVEMAIEDVVD